MKVTEIRNLNDDEIKSRVSQLKEELFNLRFRHKTNQLENPKRITIVRKEIARSKTVLNERKLKLNNKKAERQA